MQASGTEKGGLGQALRTRTAFSSILGSAPRRSGGFSLQRELCFHFGGQWQIMSILGFILVSFWAPKAQLDSLWGLPESLLGSKMGCHFKGDFCGFPGAGRILRTCLVEGDLGGLGRLSHHQQTADCILQTARCRLQDVDTQRRRMKPNPSQPGGPLKGGRRILGMMWSFSV